MIYPVPSTFIERRRIRLDELHEHTVLSKMRVRYSCVEAEESADGTFRRKWSGVGGESFMAITTGKFLLFGVPDEEFDASILESGGCIEAIKVTQHNGHYVVWDGYRRVASHRRVKLPYVYAEVLPRSFGYMSNEDAVRWWKIMNQVRG